MLYNVSVTGATPRGSSVSLYQDGPRAYLLGMDAPDPFAKDTTAQQRQDATGCAALILYAVCIPTALALFVWVAPAAGVGVLIGMVILSLWLRGLSKPKE